MGKTLDARFDWNDYSVPHPYVQRTLTVSAYLHPLRILDGDAVLAAHPRSFDKGAQIENPEHLRALAEQKHQASAHRGLNRLTHAVPLARELIAQAAARDQPLGRITRELSTLIERFGAVELGAAIEENLRLYGLRAHWDDIHETCRVESLIIWEEQERSQRSLERRLSSAPIGRFKPLADFDWHWPEQFIDEVGCLSYSNRHADLLFELINRRHEQKSTLLTTNKAFAEWSEVFPTAACVVALIDRLVHNAKIIAIKGQSYRHKEAKERAEQRAKKRAAQEENKP